MGLVPEGSQHDLKRYLSPPPVGTVFQRWMRALSSTGGSGTLGSLGGVQGNLEARSSIQISVPQVSGLQPFPSWTLRLLA